MLYIIYCVIERISTFGSPSRGVNSLQEQVPLVLGGPVSANFFGTRSVLTPRSPI